MRIASGSETFSFFVVLRSPFGLATTEKSVEIKVLS